MDYTENDELKVCLKDILNSEEVNLIPKNIQTVINCFISSKCQIYSLEKQKFNVIEKDYNDLKLKVSMQDDSLKRLKNHISDIEDSLHNARREVCEALHKKDCLELEKKTLNSEINSKNNENEHLNNLIKLKTEEVINLMQENQNLKFELNSSKGKTKSSSDEVDSYYKEILEDKDKYFENQKKYLQIELDTVTKNYHQKATEYSALFSQQNILKNDLNLKINEINRQKAVLNNHLTNMNYLIEKKDIQINDLATKVNELHQQQASLKEQFSAQDKAQEEVIEQYKKRNNQLMKDNQNLLEKIKNLHMHLSCCDDAQKATVEKMNELSIKYKSEMKLKEAEIQNLLNKLEILENKFISSSQKEIETSIQQFYPTSTTVSKLFNKNLTVPMVYSKYEELIENYENLVKENEELKLHIEDLIIESEKNAPIIYYKTQEVKKAYLMVEELKQKICKNSSDLENSFTEIENCNKTNNYLKRECKRYEQTNIDLSRQVKCLLQTIHEIKGNFVDKKFLVDDEYLEKESSSSKIISLNLVTFKDIEEMQKKNQQLLSAIRELTKQNEDLEKKNSDKEDTDLKKQLDELLVEIESLKEEKIHQQEILRELMSPNESSKHENVSNRDKQSGSPLFKVTSRAYLEEKITDLTNTIDKINKEFSNFKTTASQQENILKLEIKEHLDKMTQYQIEISKLNGNLEFSKENIKVLDSTLSRYTKEINTLKEKNIKLESKCQKLSEKLVDYENKIKTLQEKIKRLKNDRDSQRNLNQVLEQKQGHLEFENNSLKNRNKNLEDENHETKQLLDKFKNEQYVENMKSSYELKNQITLLEIKLNSLQKDYDQIVQEKKELNAKFIEKEDNLRKVALQAKQKITSLQHSNNVLGNEKEDAEKKLKILESKMHAIEQSSDENLSKAKLAKNQVELKNQLDELKKQNKILNDEKIDLNNKLQITEKKISRLNQASIQKGRLEQEVSELKINLAKAEKNLEEGQLREKMLKKQFEVKLNKQENELISLNETISNQKKQIDTLNSQIILQDNETNSKQIEQNVQHSSSSSIKPLTASVKPISINRPIIIPQATITPQNSSLMAFVAPTSVEVSSSENMDTSSTSSINFISTPILGIDNNNNNNNNNTSITIATTAINTTSTTSTTTISTSTNVITSTVNVTNNNNNNKNNNETSTVNIRSNKRKIISNIISDDQIKKQKINLFDVTSQTNTNEMLTMNENESLSCDALEASTSGINEQQYVKIDQNVAKCNLENSEQKLDSINLENETKIEDCGKLNVINQDKKSDDLKYESQPKENENINEQESESSSIDNNEEQINSENQSEDEYNEEDEVENEEYQTDDEEEYDENDENDENEDYSNTVEKENSDLVIVIESEDEDNFNHGESNEINEAVNNISGLGFKQSTENVENEENTDNIENNENYLDNVNLDRLNEPIETVENETLVQQTNLEETNLIETSIAQIAQPEEQNIKSEATQVNTEHQLNEGPTTSQNQQSSEDQQADNFTLTQTKPLPNHGNRRRRFLKRPTTFTNTLNSDKSNNDKN